MQVAVDASCTRRHQQGLRLHRREMRLLLEDGGVRDLDVNIEITDDDGLVLARGDLGRKALLIWGEYDGFASHSERRPSAETP